MGDFSAQSNDSALQEVENKSVLCSQDHLTKQRVLLGGLIAEKKNVGHFVELKLTCSVVDGLG